MLSNALEVASGRDGQEHRRFPIVGVPMVISHIVQASRVAGDIAVKAPFRTPGHH